ncbi:serine--tRNA ligase, partial [Candidatus Shapirobacteria bacterium CG10_big_fil_rev_8_21_14_0_10_36_6]
TDEQLKSATKIKEELKVIGDKLKNSSAELNNLLEEIPNICAPDVPVG